MNDLIKLLAKSCLMMLEAMCYLSSILWGVMHYPHRVQFSNDIFYWQSLALVIICFVLGGVFTVSRWLIFDTLEDLKNG